MSICLSSKMSVNFPIVTKVISLWDVRWECTLFKMVWFCSWVVLSLDIRLPLFLKYLLQLLILTYHFCWISFQIFLSFNIFNMSSRRQFALDLVGAVKEIWLTTAEQQVHLKVFFLYFETSTLPFSTNSFPPVWSTFLSPDVVRKGVVETVNSDLAVIIT